MKLQTILYIALTFFVAQGIAQTKTAKTKVKQLTGGTLKPKIGKNVTKIDLKGESYYLTKDIGYNIVGEYLYESKKEPIVQLNQDGTGLFQLHGMSKTRMIWGIECNMDGTPKKIATSWGFAYNLWYQIKEKHKGKTWESGEIDVWDIVQFSVHTDEKYLSILGERNKSL